MRWRSTSCSTIPAASISRSRCRQLWPLAWPTRCGRLRRTWLRKSTQWPRLRNRADLTRSAQPNKTVKPKARYGKIRTVRPYQQSIVSGGRFHSLSIRIGTARLDTARRDPHPAGLFFFRSKFKVRHYPALRRRAALFCSRGHRRASRCLSCPSAAPGRFNAY